MTFYSVNITIKENPDQGVKYVQYFGNLHPALSKSLPSLKVIVFDFKHFDLRLVFLDLEIYVNGIILYTFFSAWHLSYSNIYVCVWCVYLCIYMHIHICICILRFMHVLHVVYNLLFLLFFAIPCYQHPTTYCTILLLLMNRFGCRVVCDQMLWLPRQVGQIPYPKFVSDVEIMIMYKRAN